MIFLKHDLKIFFITAQVIIFKNSKGDFILELWDDSMGLAKTVNLTDLDAHGDVYLDDQLGCLALAPSSSCTVAYVAEEKRSKAVAFTKGFGATFKPADDNGTFLSDFLKLQQLFLNLFTPAEIQYFCADR